MELVKSSKDEKIKKHLLMLNDPTKKEIIDFGNELFPNSAKRQLESLVGEKIEKDRIQTTIKSLSKKYKYVFSEKEIYEECLEYNLSFAETSTYKEDFDYTYIEKIKKFVEDNNLLVSRQELRYNFMILTKTFGNKNPLIFYKHKEAGTTYYILIEGDLSYRNLFNWFLGYLHSTKESMMFGIAMLTILSILILSHTLMFLFNSTDVCIQLLILFAAVLIGLISTACVTECSYNTFSENRLSALPKKSFKIKTKDFIIVGFWLLSLLSVFLLF